MVGRKKIRVVVEKLQRSFSQAMRSSPEREFKQVCEPLSVPEDIKEGHFAVNVVGEGYPKRYVVALSYLTHPAFLRLLEQAAEEYGFDHEGALTIPCRSSELESILADQWKEQRDVGAMVGNWDSCKTMVRLERKCF